jgi:hypothetical protein
MRHPRVSHRQSDRDRTYAEAINHVLKNTDGQTLSTDALSIDRDVDIDGVVKIGGVQVVGAQGAAIADAAALTSVNGTNAVAAPTQAEFNALVAEFNKLRTDVGAIRTTLNTLLARDRAHGLIVT